MREREKKKRITHSLRSQKGHQIGKHMHGSLSWIDKKTKQHQIAQ